VGGFSNGISWSAALRDGKPYGEWLTGRLRRLVGPVLPLLLAWAVIAAVAGLQGVRPAMIRVGSQMALIPLWFQAVYTIVVVLVPLTHAPWTRFGMASVWVPVAAAALVDVAFFAADLRGLGWANYAFVWLAVHQLGYAWRDGRLAGPRQALPWCLGGLAALVAFVTFGPYPLSMVGVPGEDVSNSGPPKLTLFALGAFQGGLLLSLERPVRRWLRRAVPWTATVLVNSMIMTLYLWHLTAMTLMFGLANWMGGIGLAETPGSAAWWALRPPWMAVSAIALVVLSLLFARYERPGRETASPAVAWRLVTGSLLMCAGLAMLARDGVGGDGLLGLRHWVLLLPFVGAALVGIRPLGEPVRSS
jgi:hypothetical protein